LAKKIIDLTGSASRIVHRPLPENDPKQRRPDISRAHALLGWKPRTALNDGLLSTIEYFDTLLSEGKTRKSFRMTALVGSRAPGRTELEQSGIAMSS
jgi:UDP-glucuronate decarboxylase